MSDTSMRQQAIDNHEARCTEERTVTVDVTYAIRGQDCDGSVSEDDVIAGIKGLVTTSDWYADVSFALRKITVTEPEWAQPYRPWADDWA